MVSYVPTGREIPFDGLTAAAPDEASVTSVSSEVLAANADIISIAISNIGNQDAYFGFGQAAEANKGFVIPKGAQIIYPFPDGIKEAINCIVAAGNTTLSIQVWT